MRKFLTALVVIGIGLIFIVFAVANRHPVTVSFDPLNASNPASGVTLPLFAVIISVAILGVVAGGVATWIRQHHWRRAARRHQADAIEARAELADLRASLVSPAPNDAARMPRLLASDTGKRDKYGAAL